MSFQEFNYRFKYRPELAGYIGVEREFFVAAPSGLIVPEAPRVIAYARENFRDIASRGTVLRPRLGSLIGYELSACQVETRTAPESLQYVEGALETVERELDEVLDALDLIRLSCEVGPRDMPLDVYPDPTGRYQRLTADMPRDRLRAACRVIGTHVHVGMRNRDEALRAHNYAVRHVEELCELGNGSFGERLAIYRQMAPRFMPQPYQSWQHFHAAACEHGFEHDPRACWTLVRISVHGTIEFRMFGATDSIPRIAAWARRCHAICMEALEYA